MPTLAQMRKCVYPFPIYEAHFADGTVGRISVWQPLNKPWDWERFRKVAGHAFGLTARDPFRPGRRDVVPKRVVHGYLDRKAGEPWLADPMTQETKKPRVNGKALVRDLLRVIDGGQCSPEILEQARKWAA